MTSSSGSLAPTVLPGTIAAPSAPTADGAMGTAHDGGGVPAVSVPAGSREAAHPRVNGQVEPGSLAEESAALAEGRRAFDFGKVEQAVRLLLEGIGEDLRRDGLRDTPTRVARMYEEITVGLRTDPGEALQVMFEAEHDGMVLVRGIPLFSICEHHLAPFVGKAHVAYIPNGDGRVTGLSKLARAVDGLAKQLQVQERLTDEIANALVARLEPQGALVVIEAEHLCMSMRGVRKPGAVTVTRAVRGLFRDSQATRMEALSLLGVVPVSRHD